MAMKEVLDRAKEQGFLSVISEEYHKLSKEDLRDIIKELDYAASSSLTKKEYGEIVKLAVNELNELSEE